MSFTPRPLYPRGRTPVPINDSHSVWAPELVRTVSRTEKSAVSTGIRTPDHRACSLVTISTELLRILVALDSTEFDICNAETVCLL